MSEATTPHFPIDGWPRPQPVTHTGRFVTLTPTEPEQDAAELYGPAHATDAARDIWRFIFFGPFASPQELQDGMAALLARPGSLPFTVRLREDNRAVGMNCLLAIEPAHGRAELGSIWYLPEVQRTKVNTETCYLLLRYLFEDLGYRRAEWKCDNQNVRSKAAALRLGFSYEGLFRQHMIVKGRNRDTAWFSMLDSEWPQRRANLETYLYDDAPCSLSALNGAVPDTDSASL